MEKGSEINLIQPLVNLKNFVTLLKETNCKKNEIYEKLIIKIKNSFNQNLTDDYDIFLALNLGYNFSEALINCKDKSKKQKSLSYLKSLEDYTEYLYTTNCFGNFLDNFLNVIDFPHLSTEDKQYFYCNRDIKEFCKFLAEKLINFKLRDIATRVIQFGEVINIPIFNNEFEKILSKNSIKHFNSLFPTNKELSKAINILKSKFEEIDRECRLIILNRNSETELIQGKYYVSFKVIEEDFTCLFVFLMKEFTRELRNFTPKRKYTSWAEATETFIKKDSIFYGSKYVRNELIKKIAKSNNLVELLQLGCEYMINSIFLAIANHETLEGMEFVTKNNEELIFSVNCKNEKESDMWEKNIVETINTVKLEKWISEKIEVNVFQLTEIELHEKILVRKIKKTQNGKNIIKHILN